MRRLIALLLPMLMLCSCGAVNAPTPGWHAGYAEASLAYGDLGDYNIAGYRGGRAPTSVLDAQKIKGLWLDDGLCSTLLLVVDCVALDSGSVSRIRDRLADFVRETGCGQVDVIATHTHAGVDTLGLWGEVGIDGKNADFMAQLVEVAAEVAHCAYADRRAGRLTYAAVETEGLLHDSRAPEVYDPHLYQLRFAPDDGTAGIRLVSYAAHAEALRGDNLALSADFPGALAAQVEAACGDRLLFVPGAIGGLIMTVRLADDAVESMRLTAERLAEYLLALPEGDALAPALRISRVTFETPLENSLFLDYKFLGIVGNDMVRRPFGRYAVRSELSLLALGDIVLALLPGELFPELVGGLAALAAERGIETLIPVGLANDELGYIIPESDFVLHPDAPYIVEAEGHYEETNAVGRRCAADLTDAFVRALDGLQ